MPPMISRYAKRHYVLRVVEWVRRQGNVFVQTHSRSFKSRAALSARECMQATRLFVVYLGNDDLAHMMNKMKKAGVFPGDVWQLHYGEGLEFVATVATSMWDLHYLSSLRTDYRDTPLGRQVPDATRDLCSHFENFVRLRYQSQMPAIELELLMPEKQRLRRKSVPKTLVEKRADAAATRLRQWQRRLKIAKTKVTEYQRKVSYYQEKGVLCDSQRS